MEKIESLLVATFTTMLRYLGIATCLLIVTIALGQGTSNPFDLRFRKPKPATISAPAKPNPVQDTINQITPATNIPPTVKGSTPSENEKVIGTVDAAKPDPVNQSNPFEKNAAPDTSKSIASHAPVVTTPAEPVKEIVPPALKTKASKGLQIFFILLSLLFLIFIVNVERSFVRDLWRVISNENYSSLHHRNQRNTMRQILLIMGYAVFVFQAGIFLFNALRIYGSPSLLGKSLWVALGLVLCIYLVRHAIIRYLRWLFNISKEMTLFGFDISIFNIMVGIVLLPINILLLFGPDNIFKPLIVIGILVLIAAYLLRQLRWTLGARRLITRSLFLFFIYLCAVEILPLWAVSTLFW